MIHYEDLKVSNAPFIDEMNEAADRVIHSGHFVLGPEVAAFETEFAQYVGTRYCVGVANGLDALTLSLAALDLPKGGEVIVPANSYFATILAVLRLGLTPVLVEPCLASYNIDPQKIEGKITERSVAICLTHLYGKSADMEAIAVIATKHKLYIIEDCAQSHGARLGGRMTGSFGNAGCFSFYPTKNLGCVGDGGAITTNDASLDQRLRMLRNYGSSQKYRFSLVGWNSRLDEIQAAMLRVKLRHLDAINAHKNALAQVYFSRLAGAIILPHQSDGFEDVHHIFPIRHPRRERLRELLHERGIETLIHYPIPPHEQDALKGFGFEQQSITKLIHDTVLSLPISFGHSKTDIERVCEEILQIIQ